MLMKCCMVRARKLCCTRKLPQINGIFRRECKTLIFLNDGIGFCSFAEFLHCFTLTGA